MKLKTEDMLDDLQWTGINFLLKNRFSALFVDLGLGKTIMSLMVLIMLRRRGQKFKRALIIAPLRVAAQTWPTELVEWKQLRELTFTVIRAEDDDDVIKDARSGEAKRVRPIAYETSVEAGFPNELSRWISAKIATAAAGRMATERKEELRRELAQADTHIHIIDDGHIEWLVELYSEYVEKKVRGRMRRLRRIVDWPYDIVIYDEFSRAKDYTTLRFGALRAIRPQLERLHGLTATPAAEDYMGIFAQIWLLDMGKRFGSFITHFREKYFSYNPYRRSYKLLPGADRRIAKKAADICLIMKDPNKKPPIILDRKIHLQPSELKALKQFQRDFIMEFPDGEEIEAETASVLAQKLLQLASGSVYRDDRTFRAFHDRKLDMLKALHEELLGEPLLVAYWYKHSLARLKKWFPKAAIMDSAGRCIPDWNAGKIDMLFVHPAGVAHGLNMQYGPGHDLALFDSCWSNELYRQLIGRLNRRGQKQTVRVHRLITVGTPDELVAERLDEKEDAQEALFRYIRRQQRKNRERELALVGLR